MPDRLGYLGTLEAEARRRLGPETARALAEEASEHLEESIQARLELGLSVEQAESEAVTAFGPAARIVRREVAMRQGRWHSPLLAALTVLGATWIPLALSGTALANVLFSLAALVFLAVVVPFIMACATRRPGRPLVGSVAAFWLLATVLLSALCGPYYGGPAGRSTLASIADFYAGHAEARARREAKYDRLGWPSTGLRTRTRRDRAAFATMGERARRASQAVDLGGSARLAAEAATAFALYLVLLYTIGAWCGRMAASGSRWTRWDFWRPE